MRFGFVLWADASVLVTFVHICRSPWLMWVTSATKMRLHHRLQLISRIQLSKPRSALSRAPNRENKSNSKQSEGNFYLFCTFSISQLNQIAKSSIFFCCAFGTHARVSCFQVAADSLLPRLLALCVCRGVCAAVTQAGSENGDLQLDQNLRQRMRLQPSSKTRR